MNPVEFIYFSGTGNTLLAVEAMASVITKSGPTVDIKRMEKTKPEEIDVNKTLGIAFPAACFSTYPFVQEFVSNLPQTTAGTPVFLLTTMGGMCGGNYLSMGNTLTRKGYKLLGAAEVTMPSNFMNKDLPKAKIEAQVQKGLRQAQTFARALVNNRATWKRNYFLGTLVPLMMNPKRAIKFMLARNPIVINQAKCTQCGICYKICPVENIFMYEFPRFNDNCQLCMRCLSYCPSGAIHFTKGERAPYKAVKLEKLLGDDKK